jgi:hypothetical protein
VRTSRVGSQPVGVGGGAWCRWGWTGRGGGAPLRGGGDVGCSGSGLAFYRAGRGAQAAEKGSGIARVMAVA